MMLIGTPGEPLVELGCRAGIGTGRKPARFRGGERLKKQLWSVNPPEPSSPGSRDDTPNTGGNQRFRGGSDFPVT